MKSEDNTREANERNDDNFIMLPTVDFCFKGLMNNPKVRKGFIAALLKNEKDLLQRFLRKIRKQSVRRYFCRLYSVRNIRMTNWGFSMSGY